MNQVIQITDHFHYNKICYPLPQQDSIKNWNKNINALERYGIFNVTLPILLLERYIFFAILLHKTKFACRYINVQENSTKLWCFCHIHVATLFYIFIGKICWTFMVTISLLTTQTNMSCICVSNFRSLNWISTEI